jgi:hypothetical protein
MIVTTSDVPIHSLRVERRSYRLGIAAVTDLAAHTAGEATDGWPFRFECDPQVVLDIDVGGDIDHVAPRVAGRPAVLVHLHLLGRRHRGRGRELADFGQDERRRQRVLVEHRDGGIDVIVLRQLQDLDHLRQPGNPIARDGAVVEQPWLEDRAVERQVVLVGDDVVVAQDEALLAVRNETTERPGHDEPVPRKADRAPALRRAQSRPGDRRRLREEAADADADHVLIRCGGSRQGCELGLRSRLRQQRLDGSRFGCDQRVGSVLRHASPLSRMFIARQSRP